jgi:hypothetical protein
LEQIWLAGGDPKLVQDALGPEGRFAACMPKFAGARQILQLGAYQEPAPSLLQLMVHARGGVLVHTLEDMVVKTLDGRPYEAMYYVFHTLFLF